MVTALLEYLDLLAVFLWAQVVFMTILLKYFHLFNVVELLSNRIVIKTNTKLTVTFALVVLFRIGYGDI